MDKNLTTYIKKYTLFSHDECDLIIDELQNHEFLRHAFVSYDGVYSQQPGDPTFYNTSDGKMPPDLYKSIMDKLYSTIQSYIDDVGFSWYTAWNGYTAPKFNYYTPGTYMRDHCDHIDHIFPGNPKGVPVLSMIATLNDKFEGGEFILCEEDHSVSKGEIVVFPSNFLYPHRVDPLTSGTRVSMVSWVY